MRNVNCDEKKNDRKSNYPAKINKAKGECNRVKRKKIVNNSSGYINFGYQSGQINLVEEGKT